MSIHWEKVLTDPLGFAGYALFLMFSVVTVVVKQRKPRNEWIVPAGFALATVCVLGGLALAYHREPKGSVASPNTTAPNSSMHIDKIEQNVGNGNAVAGVQGDVSSSPAPPPNGSKAKR